ncbi:hypothetical protein Cob_v012890 [Colletotrichum orbiculare MAFF 240422]|uniref:Ubiquitin 3 binding protein But2 C-terminal domain-containing protein n=1 Tax=Colletotrichum orbiculare (strain 104-T / ATCC 96160 / CBS 514.97 / LARS 414 / MAFF 240422) TaxID=1213857 RepID=N4UNZ1_COLOR|nr:hypothetical protein Cob_v012890 [Colletotrichum orbiculare MAFF 240422]
MFAKTLITLLLTAASTLAAPLETRQAPSTYFTPSARYTYNVATGAITPSSTGLVHKFPSNAGQDVTTLLTFTYPAAAAGKKCQFHFFTEPGSSEVSGSRKLDVYTSTNPAPGATTGWGPGNQRNVNIGRLGIAASGYATWDATFGAYLTAPTDCKPAGTVEGFELVGVYDNDLVKWTPPASGARIAYF